jgi:hypothetical protein
MNYLLAQIHYGIKRFVPYINLQPFQYFLNAPGKTIVNLHIN